ncbi:MAG: hypothetical protein AAF533_04905 [Acidobacteriota bacterium]
MEMGRRDLEDLLGQVDEVLDLDDDARRRRVVDELVAELETRFGPELSGELAYLTGYLLYQRPGGAELSEKMERLFVRAAQGADEDTVARSSLYLGHVAYDQRDYYLAKERFALVQENELHDFLRTKLLEMRACCHLRLRELPQFLASLEVLVVTAEGLPIEDVCPQNLAAGLEEASLAEARGSRAALLSLARRLDAAAGFEDWISERMESSLLRAR